MDLFRQDPAANLLPRDGTVNYHGRIFSDDLARNFHAALMAEVPWRHDEVVMFGKRIVTAREVAWYGDADFSYTYSGSTKRALPWTRTLVDLKRRAEARTGDRFNSCLLNLYHTGSEGMGWHSDDERSLAPCSAIASVSLGAERTFVFKHKRTGEKVSVLLENASLLVMKDETQAHWLHQLPTTRKVTASRINLTFRTMLDS